MRPTLSDIATATGLSLATVDRVINGRSGVARRTRHRVMRAARELGYLADGSDGPATPLHLTLLLPSGTNAFIQALADEAAAQGADLPDTRVTVERVDGFTPGLLAQALADQRADGIALVALNHPLVRQAIRDATARGIPVVTVASDITDSPRLAYVGIDNGQAGRLAGDVMGRFLGRGTRGKVALLAGSLAYRGHQEREMGFRQILAEAHPRLTLLELRESLDDRRRAEAELGQLLAKHRDLAGIYNAGGGTVGVARALQAAGVADRVVFLAHDATRETAKLLLDGTLDAVIDQNARAEIAEALAILIHELRGVPYRSAPPRLQLILRENVPSI